MNTRITKGLLWPFAAAGIVTAFSWLALGKNSPVNHGVSPNAYENHLAALFAFPNVPAETICASIFGKQFHEWSYFFFVFIQWLLIAAIVRTSMSLSKEENAK
jgi:hypothetical protein